MENKSESLADKTLTEKATQKPEPKLEASVLLGKIFTLMKKKREQDLRYRTQENRKNFEAKLQQTQTDIKIVESVKESKGEGKKAKKEKSEPKVQKKGKSFIAKLFETFSYPGGVAGVLTDTAIITGLIINHNKEAEKITKEFDNLIEDDLLEKLKSFDYKISLYKIFI